MNDIQNFNKFRMTKHKAFILQQNAIYTPLPQSDNLQILL